MRMKIREQRLGGHGFQKTNASRATSADGSPVSGTRRSSRRTTVVAEKQDKSPDEEWVFDCICGTNGINYV
jgi:hypothetical protein